MQCMCPHLTRSTDPISVLCCAARPAMQMCSPCVFPMFLPTHGDSELKGEVQIEVKSAKTSPRANHFSLAFFKKINGPTLTGPT